MCKIAMLSVHTCPLARPGTKDAGGMNVYVRQLSQELAARGMEVDIYTRSTDPRLPQVARLGPQVRVIHLQAGVIGPLPKESLFDHLPEFVWHLCRFAESSGAEYKFLHSHYWLSGWVGRQLQRRWQIPHVVMFHTLEKLKEQALPQEGENWRRTLIEERVMAAADAIVAATQHEKDQIMNSYGARSAQVEVVPCGVDLETFKPMDKDKAKGTLGMTEKRLILFVGRLERLKGIDTLLQALSLIRDKEDVHLLVVGGDHSMESEEARLRKAARGLDLDRRVIFIDAVDHKDLPVYYNAADICVIPSYYESFGLVALEALACGTPVVASSVGGLPTIIEHNINGLLVPWRSPRNFAIAIDALLSDGELYARLRRHARASAQSFQWATVAERVIGLYRRLAASRASQHQCLCEAI